MQDPDLAQQYPELQPVADKARARHAKEAGNRAFAAKQYEEAVQHFTSALTLHNDPIYFSNRAAAHLALKQYRQAAEDSRHVIALDKKWVKGWSRLAAAHSGLEEWSEVSVLSDKELEDMEICALKSEGPAVRWLWRRQRRRLTRRSG